MKAFIYIGGGIDPKNITEHPKGDDLVIAADAGYCNAQTLGVKVDLLLGDFDSLGEKEIPKEEQGKNSSPRRLSGRSTWPKYIHLRPR